MRIAEDIVTINPDPHIDNLQSDPVGDDLRTIGHRGICRFAVLRNTQGHTPAYIVVHGFGGNDADSGSNACGDECHELFVVVASVGPVEEYGNVLRWGGWVAVLEDVETIALNEEASAFLLCSQ